MSGARLLPRPGLLDPRFRRGRFHVGDNVEFRRNFRAELATPEAMITIGSGS